MLFLSLQLSGQTEKIIGTSLDQQPIETMVSEPPVFPGGVQALQTYIRENLVIPETVTRMKLNGSTSLRLIINRDGSIGSITVLKSMEDCPECDDEAIKLMRGLPVWTPATKEGETVTAPWNITIHFPHKKKK